MQGHEQCPGQEERFHLVLCPKYGGKCPGFENLFDDKHLHRWRAWWTHHDFLGLGIPRQHAELNDIRIVAGNPFTHVVTVEAPDGTRSTRKVERDCRRCGRRVAGSHTCHRVTLDLNMKYKFMTGHDGKCGHCGTVMYNRREAEHLNRNPECQIGWKRKFYTNIRDRWDEWEPAMVNGLVVEFVYRSITGNACDCGTVMARKRNIRGHLRELGSDVCFEAGMKGLRDWLDKLDDADLGAED